MRRLFVAFLFVGLTLSTSAKKRPAADHGSAAAATLPRAAAPAVSSVDAARIRAHVKFLSSDLLEGRGTGQRGGDLAAEYIASQFARDGLKPGGDDGRFLQKVSMVGITTEPATTITFATPSSNTMKLKLWDDIVAGDQSQSAASDVDTELVFVGYGIAAPEYGWDDYKGTDVTGKVLLMFTNEPPSDDPKFFKGKSLTYYGRWTYKYEEASRRGAVGVLLIHKTEMASYGWDVVKNSWSGERSVLQADGGPKLKLAGWVQWEIARKLMADTGHDLDALLKQVQSRDFKPIPLSVNVKARIVSKVRSFAASNVVAIVPGSDPKLKDQAIVYSAHYDHLGIHTDMPGDNIYNGAVDNATGCGILLEMARAVAASAHKPRRSMVFVAVTGEEQGLLGSEHFALHPPFPAANISVGLNFDSYAPSGIPEEISASGAERTTFRPTVEFIARQLGMQLRPPGNDTAGGYYRSDHFSFAQVGIPAFSIGQGQKFRGHPAEWAREKDKVRRSTYHQPTDEFREDWDFSGLAELARFGIALGWKAADQPGEVQWQKGDEFEPARLRAQSAAGSGTR